jgi:3-oxoacyl-[acyl-carrier-protein] synthase-1
MREVCAPLAAAGVACPPLPVYLGLPELRPGFTGRDVESVRHGCGRFDVSPLELAEVTVFAQGHAAGLAALAMAVKDITRGAIESCLVGGVDSYFQPDSMEWLDANRQLAGTVSRSGFVPGEGAGFCLLMSASASQRYGLAPLARVRSAAVGKETKLIKTSDICLGEGLTATVRAAVSSLRLPDERVNEVLSDINGERYRSEEWGFVCLRLSECFDDPTAYVTPADCWGDMGAASGPLFAMLACQAGVRGYAKGPLTLLSSSSESGLRGVALIESSAVTTAFH